MASKYLVRPLWAFRQYIPSSLPQLVRPYSQHVTKAYENLLVELPKPGVGLSMSILMPFHSIQYFKLSADVSVVY